MKCIITYIQNKRAVLPYLFNKYCFPEMRRLFPGEMKLYHIFHDYCGKDGELHLESNLILDEFNLRNVHKFINDGKYPHATIIKHDEVNPELLMLPSLQIALDVGQRQQADLHLWMEDDSIILDRDCDKWHNLMVYNGADVGLYRETETQMMVNASYFLSTAAYDRKLELMVANYKQEPHEKYWNLGSQYEHLLWRCADKTVLLNPGAAVRHHTSKRWPTSLDQVRVWLRRNIPAITGEEIAMLNIDFGVV